MKCINGYINARLTNKKMGKKVAIAMINNDIFNRNNSDDVVLEIQTSFRLYQTMKCTNDYKR